MVTPTPAQRLAPRVRPNDVAVMRQRWSGLLFLHWPIDPAVIQARLPDGLFVDTFENQAWLGVVPFFMERVRPVLFPPLPGLSWFLELNVRTYVHDRGGRPGVWFFSLDCNQPVAVETARRFFHLPYEHASMKSVSAGDRVHYTSTRKTHGTRAAEYHYGLPVAAQPALEGSLAWFLVERYLLFSSNKKGDLFCGQVHHSPYRIAPAACDRWSTEPLRLNGFDEPELPPASLLVAEPVDVAIHPLRRVHRAGGCPAHF